MPATVKSGGERDTHSSYPNNFLSFAQTLNSFTISSFRIATMGIIDEMCNLVSGFKIDLPEKTEFKVKIQRKEGRKKKEGFHQPGQQMMKRLKRSEYVELKALKQFWFCMAKVWPVDNAKA